MYNKIWGREYIKLELRMHRDDISRELIGELDVDSIMWTNSDDETWIQGLETWANAHVSQYKQVLSRCSLDYLLDDSHSDSLASAIWSIGISIKQYIDPRTYSEIMESDHGINIVMDLVMKSTGELSVVLKKTLYELGLERVWYQRCGERCDDNTNNEKYDNSVKCCDCNEFIACVTNRPCGCIELCLGCYTSHISDAHKCKKCSQVVLDYALTHNLT